MTHRTRRLILAISGVLIIIALIIAVVITTRSANGDSADEHPSATPSATLSSEQNDAVLKALLTVARFTPDNDSSEAARRQSYQRVGLSPELVASFAPIWVDVLPLANSSYNPEPKLTGLIAAKGAETTAVERTDVDGRPSLRVTVEISQSFSFGGSTDDPDYRLQVDNGFDATWTAFLDEETNQVTAIEQPAIEDLPKPLQNARAASLRHLYKG